MTPLLPSFTPARFADVAQARDRVYCCDERLQNPRICAIIKMPSRAANTEGVSRHYTGMATMPQYITRLCPVCNREYQADVGRLKYGRQTTCSRKCSYVYRSQKLQQLETRHCLNCGSPVTRIPSAFKHEETFCSKTCHNLHRAKIGGYKTAFQQYRFCLICGKHFRAKKRANHYCSRQCFEIAHKDNMRGKRNPSYVDGRSINKYYDAGSEWHEIRRTVYKRDKYTCQHCGVKCIAKSKATPETSHRIIQCHHIDPYKQSHNNDLSNLITLCIRCHHRIHHAGAS